jgi:hypothetical protein
MTDSPKSKKPTDIRDIITELRRPFTSESVKVKIQALNNGGAIVVRYIDSRNVAERLNVVCPGAWDDEYNVLLAKDNQIYGVEATIGIMDLSDPNHAVVKRSDVGTITTRKDTIHDPDPRMGGLKILYSDAFKRAGVKWGIGAFLYTLPTEFAPNRVLDGEGNKRRLTDSVRETMRLKYEKWLLDKGNDLFGEPLDHGDMEDSQGDIEVDEEGGEDA